MATRTIQVSDEAYRRLQAEANRLQLTPEQLVERLLTGVGADLISSADEQDTSLPLPGSPSALAAVQRLTTLFSDAAIPDVDRVLADPALTLANADLLDVQR